MRGLQKLHNASAERFRGIEQSMEALLESGYRESVKQINAKNEEDLSPPSSPAAQTEDAASD